MVVTVQSLGLQGITGYEVAVECALSGGLPAFDVVGLPDAAVKEARERVRAAVRSCGAKLPVSRITVNLAPAALRKEGTVYDLPILLGILAAQGLNCDNHSASSNFFRHTSFFKKNFSRRNFVTSGSANAYLVVSTGGSAPRGPAPPAGPRRDRTILDAHPTEAGFNHPQLFRFAESV